MANNRLYIKNKETGEQLLLAKIWPGKLELWHYENEIEKWLSENIGDNILYDPNSAAACPFVLELENMRDTKANGE